MRVRRLLRLVLTVAVGAPLLVYGAVVWIVAESAIHPSPGPIALDLRGYPGLQAPITLRWTGARDAHLVGHLFLGRLRATLILSHGYGATEGMMLPWAGFLHHAGFTVVTYNMRGRGPSTGEVTLGALESRDLSLLVTALSRRPDVDPHRIAALGVSLGAAVSIMAAAHDPRLRAVVDDCGFSDALHVVASSFTFFTGIPSALFAGPTVLLTEWRTNVALRDVSPVAVIAHIAPRPLLIIHGTADLLVPPDNSRRLFAAARQPKELWWVPGAPHTASYTYEAHVYEQRVTAFFRHALFLP